MFNHISNSYYGIHGCTYLTEKITSDNLWYKRTYLSDIFGDIFPQDKISGICHLSCSYQAKEADSVKEKTYCIFHFI